MIQSSSSLASLLQRRTSSASDVSLANDASRYRILSEPCWCLLGKGIVVLRQRNGTGLANLLAPARDSRLCAAALMESRFLFILEPFLLFLFVAFVSLSSLSCDFIDLTSLGSSRC
jgi:hypothetical protein